MSYTLIHEFARPIFASEHRRMVVEERGGDVADFVPVTKYVPKARFAPLKKRTALPISERTRQQVEFIENSNHPMHCECWRCRQTTNHQIKKAITVMEDGVEVSDVSRRNIQPWERLNKAELAEFAEAMRRREEGKSSDMTLAQLDAIEAGFDKLEDKRRCSLRLEQEHHDHDHQPLKRTKLESFVSSRYRRSKGLVDVSSRNINMLPTPRNEAWAEEFLAFIRDWRLEDNGEGLWTDEFLGVLPFEFQRIHFERLNLERVKKEKAHHFHFRVKSLNKLSFAQWLKLEKSKKGEPRKARKAA